MWITSIGRISFTIDDGITTRTILPLLTGEIADLDIFFQIATEIDGFHLGFRRTCRCSWRESIIVILVDEGSRRSIVTATRISSTSDDRHTSEDIPTSTCELRGKPCSHRVRDHIYILSIDTKTITYVSDDRIDEGDILARPGE